MITKKRLERHSPAGKHFPELISHVTFVRYPTNNITFPHSSCPSPALFLKQKKSLTSQGGVSTFCSQSYTLSCP